jgi:hypothetical protein
MSVSFAMQDILFKMDEISFIKNAHLEQIIYVFSSRRHSSPVIVVVFGVSPVLELKWSGVDEKEIHNL